MVTPDPAAKDKAVRMIIIGTEAQALDVLRQDRPELGREQILVINNPDQLRGRNFRACISVRLCAGGDPALYSMALARRTLPALLPKGPRKAEGDDAK